MSYGKDRRKGVDWISKVVNFSNIFSWIAFLLALILFHYARPEVEYLIYHLVKEQISVRTSWIADLKYWLEITLYFCLTLSVITIGLNQFRLKRRTDRQRYNVYMLGVMSLVFIVTISVN
jgi:hypothetical protein